MVFTEAEFQEKLKKAREESEYRQQLQQIRDEKKKYRKPIETNKIIAIYLFAMLNALVVYAMVVMWKFQDLTYLGVLITDIAAQILLYGIYCLKAYHGKKQEEEMKYKRECSTALTLNEIDSGEAEG